MSLLTRLARRAAGEPVGAPLGTGSVAASSPTPAITVDDLPPTVPLPDAPQPADADDALPAGADTAPTHDDRHATPPERPAGDLPAATHVVVPARPAPPPPAAQVAGHGGQDVRIEAAGTRTTPPAVTPMPPRPPETPPGPPEDDVQPVAGSADAAGRMPRRDAERVPRAEPAGGPLDRPPDGDGAPSQPTPAATRAPSFDHPRPGPLATVAPDTPPAITGAWPTPPASPPGPPAPPEPPAPGPVAARITPRPEPVTPPPTPAPATAPPDRTAATADRPVDVHIGTIEIVADAPPAPPAAPGLRGPVGFERYDRLRRYDWD